MCTFAIDTSRLFWLAEDQRKGDTSMMIGPPKGRISQSCSRHKSPLSNSSPHTTGSTVMAILRDKRSLNHGRYSSKSATMQPFASQIEPQDSMLVYFLSPILIVHLRSLSINPFRTIFDATDRNYRSTFQIFVTEETVMAMAA